MTDRKKIALVMPTIREDRFNDFVARWEPLGLFDLVDLLLVEDNPKKTFDGRVATEHYDWSFIGDELEDDCWIIPRRSDTVRSFGYLMAGKLKYPYVMTLDDDCYPPIEEDGFIYQDAEQFVNAHLNCLNNRSKWFSTLNEVKPRGVPFNNLGKRDDIILNHGLWTNVLDYDAPTQLVSPKKESFDWTSRIVPQGSFYPMCGMNVMWRGAYTVWMYHLLMGKKWDLQNMTPDFLESLPFDRFGDIWCGLFFKKLADVSGLSVATGIPYVRHERASNPFTNLKKEANGLEVNEDFWEHVDHFFLPPHYLNSESPAGLYQHLGHHIGQYDKFPEYVWYFEMLGDAMVKWARRFQ
jgi:hypothetical protein